MSYRRFWTTYRSYQSQALTLEDEADRLSRNIGEELPVLAA